MSASPASQPRRAPPHRRTRGRLPCADRFLRLLHHALSAWRSTRWHQRLLDYVLALLISGGTALVTLLLVLRFPAFHLEGVLLIVGIVTVALTWGTGPGLLATLAGTGLLAFLVLPPHFSWQLQDPSKGMEVLVLLLGGGGTSLLASQSAWARRRAEALAARLAEAQESHDLERLRLRALVESLPAPVALVDAQEQVLEYNPAVQRLFWGEAAPRPRELADFQGAKAWWPDTGQPVTPRTWAIARAVLTGERVTNEEVEIETCDGQRKIVLDSATPIRDERGVIHGAVGILQDITEHKRLEEALRQAEREAAARTRELEVIFEALTDGLLVYDAQGHILRCNTAARGIFGFAAQPEGAALPLHTQRARYVPIDERGQPLPADYFPLPRILQGEIFTGAHTVDARIEALDGVERIVNLAGTPLRNAEGTILGAVGVVRDVTEQRRLEREVAEHAAQLETIFESIADGVVVMDRQERVLHMNQALRTLVGLEQDPTGWTFPQLEEIAGFAGYTAEGQLLREIPAPPHRRALQGEVLTKEQSVDHLFRTRDGREVQVNASTAPIRDARGQISGCVGVLRDVTGQRRLEQQTRDTLDALLAMAEALVQTPDQVPAAGAAAGPELYPAARHLAELTRSVLGCQQVSIVAVEPVTSAMTPITLVGLEPADEQQWWADLEEHPPMGQRLHPDVVAALQTGEPVLLERRQPPLLIWQHLTPQRASLLVPMQIGETLVGLLRVDCGAQGEEDASAHRQMLTRAVARLGALALERERLLREREEARASELALRETTAQMDTFLGMAGHELKPPLTSIKLALQLTERRIRRPLQRETEGANTLVAVLDQLARAEHQADRLDRLVNDLLDGSRVRAGKLDLQLEPADLATIVREAVEEQRQANPERTLLLHVPPESAVPVTVDADRIGQVVTNYLTNALKYSPADRQVEVGLTVYGQQARVWVRDQGPGLPPEEQERIWERFQRGKGIAVQSGPGEGLGLGLYICRTILERHQGQVGIQSAPGQGSTFWFTVPRGRQG